MDEGNKHWATLVPPAGDSRTHMPTDFSTLLFDTLESLKMVLPPSLLETYDSVGMETPPPDTPENKAKRDIYACKILARNFLLYEMAKSTTLPICNADQTILELNRNTVNTITSYLHAIWHSGHNKNPTSIPEAPDSDNLRRRIAAALTNELVVWQCCGHSTAR